MSRNDDGWTSDPGHSWMNEKGKRHNDDMSTSGYEVGYGTTKAYAVPKRQIWKRRRAAKGRSNRKLRRAKDSETKETNVRARRNC
jgi:hypothetical protein